MSHFEKRKLPRTIRLKECGWVGEGGAARSVPPEKILRFGAGPRRLYQRILGHLPVSDPSPPSRQPRLSEDRAGVAHERRPKALGPRGPWETLTTPTPQR